MFPKLVALGDLDRDQHQDLVAGRGNRLEVRLGIGDGSFGPTVATLLVGSDARAAVIGDLDGDAIPDVATVNRGSHSVSVLLGIGDGSFEPARDYRSGDGASYVATADVNGDSRPDLVVANASIGDVSVLLNRSAQAIPAHGLAALVTTAMGVLGVAMLQLRRRPTAQRSIA